jgi:cellulose synthase/poly-beta-1,6-N-acetylglucosamine synthase-like glycosyltransferase
LIPALENTPIAPPAGSAGALLTFAALAYTACQAALVLYASHRWVVLLRPRTAPPAASELAGALLPTVTVQLPVYDEPGVIGRLIAAAAALDYPRDRLEVQVLDDSDDDTSRLAALAIARLRSDGLDITHVRREHRDGFKAGALSHGLACSHGELIAVFDADFVPPPDFLRRTVGRFTDPRVGMVQARWGHLNRAASALTAAQAVMLDAHFLLEHATRMARGMFFNFNGTAGVWRRACIADAGGWSHDTLTEDMDLSYRAQLRGWRFVFDPELVVPAELPSDMAAFKSQQRRWARGSIQTARKLLPALLRGALPWRVKLEAFVHLTSNAAYPVLLALGLLLLPVLLAANLLPGHVVWTLQALVLLLGAVPVALFLAAGQRAAGRTRVQAARDTAMALVLGAGLSANNALAVLAGLGGDVGRFDRTPKTGETGAARPARRVRVAWPGLAGSGEMALAAYFAAVFAWAAGAHQWRALPFLALMAAGLAWVGAGSRTPSEAARR